MKVQRLEWSGSGNESAKLLVDSGPRPSLKCVSIFSVQNRVPGVTIRNTENIILRNAYAYEYRNNTIFFMFILIVQYLYGWY